MHWSAPWLLREDYGILVRSLGARRIEATLKECYMTPGWANSFAEDL